MTPGSPLLLESIEPLTRKALVSARIDAMRGRFEKASARLKRIVALTPPEKAHDLAALGLLWSELFHLNNEATEGISIFKEIVQPRQPHLSIPTQLVASANLAELQLANHLSDGLSTFYHVVDRRRVAQFDLYGDENLIAAQSAVDKNSFADALPILWQNLVRSHRLASWRASKWTSQRLGILYLRAGALEQACHYLVMAEANNDMEQLAAAITVRSDSHLIRAILIRIIEFANLRRHFMVACKLLTMLPDLIPDDFVERVADWLLPRCRETADKYGGGVMTLAWEAIRELGPRLNRTTSQAFIETALSHEEWQAPPPGGNRFLPNRDTIVKAVTLLSYSAPKEYLPYIADATLPLAIDQTQDNDYRDVIELICNLVHLGGDALKTHVRNKLFAPGRTINRLLVLVSEHFDVNPLDPQKWEDFANNVINETGLMIQEVKNGDPPEKLAESMMTVTQTTSSGQIHVSVLNGTGVHALSKGKRNLSDATIERLIRALMEMALRSDNLPTNRTQLLSQMCEFSDRASKTLCADIVRALEPLCSGSGFNSTDFQILETRNDPLARFKVDVGRLEQVQSVALVTASTFCGSDPALNRLLDNALSEGFVHPDATVRAGAFTAARCLPNLAGEQLLPIIMGLRDPDPSAATAAFAAIGARKEWPLTRPMWKLFLLSVRLAEQSKDVRLRRNAAIALRERLSDAPTAKVRDDAFDLLKEFSTDSAYSVRRVVTLTNTGDAD